MKADLWMMKVAAMSVLGSFVGRTNDRLKRDLASGYQLTFLTSPPVRVVFVGLHMHAAMT
jgi:hypothetical protein